MCVVFHLGTFVSFFSRRFLYPGISITDSLEQIFFFKIFVSKNTLPANWFYLHLFLCLLFRSRGLLLTLLCWERSGKFDKLYSLILKLITQLFIKAIFKESQKKLLHHLQWHNFSCLSPSSQVNGRDSDKHAVIWSLWIWLCYSFPFSSTVEHLSSWVYLLHYC